jgi:hypothetical protein
MEEYDRVSRCKCNFKRNKTKCVRVRPDVTVETAPYKRVQKRCTCGFRYNKSTGDCIPAAIPNPVQVLHPLIEVERQGKKCPPTFTYNYKTKKCIKCPDGTKKYRNRCILLPTEEAPRPTEDKAEVVLPAPDIRQAEPAPYTLLEYLNAIEESGKHATDVSYKAGRYMLFVYIYLLRKYATECSLFRDMFHLSHSAVLNYKINNDELLYPNNLGHQMQQCILRGSDLIFITLWMYRTTDEGGGSHVNILIYRPFKKTVERYEPHGQQTHIKDFKEYKLNAKLKRLFEEQLAPKLMQWTPKYKTPYEICPTSLGFQGIEGAIAGSGQGYCQMWNMFMMETTLLNPTLNTKDIIERCLDIGKRSPEYFKNIIRGYTFQISKEIQQFLGPDFDLKSGTEKARSKFKELDAHTLIMETLQQTNKRFKPRQPITEDDGGYTLTIADITEIEKQVDTLTEKNVCLYYNYVKYNFIIKPFQLMRNIHPDSLKNILLNRHITWENLMLRIYNTLFTIKMDTKQVNCCKYFLRYNAYPKNFIHGKLTMPVNVLEVMEHTKKTFPLFHHFWELFNTAQTLPELNAPLSKSTQKTIYTEVKRMPVSQLKTALALMMYKEPTPPDDKKEHFKSIPEKDKQDRLYMLLVNHHLTHNNVLEWASMY